MSSETTVFEPSKYLMQISGKDYLEVKWRLLWLRTQHPQAAIETELVKDDGSNATFKARVTLPEGGVATGWGSESYQDFGDYMEKAETKALGRALAALGFGTQFCQDFDFGAADAGRIVDSPVDIGRVRGVNGGGGGRRSFTPEPATERQIKAIYAIGHAGHLSDADIAQLSQEHFSCPPEQLDRRGASTFIDRLKQEIAANAAETSA